jgi:hypothetical protein
MVLGRDTTPLYLRGDQRNIDDHKKERYWRTVGDVNNFALETPNYFY